ncbi:FAD-dependent oxidoreductase [Streptomyces sp. NRRL S-448]|uniref:FAD-dependent oxidoreductase n=1 Tax=Streptomyces sp. NRRL S-448 TaxID=1463907 RepID=UPI00356A6DBF
MPPATATPVRRVVGAGPTGLMLGCLLRHHGIQCTVIEQRDGIDPRTRAVMVHASGLETPFPYYVNVPQPDVEAVLAARFTTAGGRLLRGLRYTRHQQDEHGVTAETVTDGAPHTITLL